MRRRKKRGMLLPALALLAGAWLMAAYMAQLDEEARAEPAEAEAAGYDLSVGTQKDMTALSWSWNGGTVNLRRNARGRWENADDPGCPLDNAKAGALARAAAGVTASMAIEGVTEFSQYGLDEPQLTVLAAAGDTIVAYDVGNGSITGEYYVRVDGGDTVYLENGGLAAAFRTELAPLLETESLPGDVAEVTGLSVKTDAQSYELRLENGQWQRTDGGALQALEAGPVRALYGLLLATDLTDCVGWDAAAACGFDEPQGRVTLTYLDGAGTEASFTLEFGDYDGRDVFVRFAGSGLVYRTNAAALDALMYPDWTSMLPLKVLEQGLDPEKIGAIVFGRDGAEYEVLRLREAEDTEVIYSMNGWVLDTKRTDAWLAALGALTAEGTAAADKGRAELFSVRFEPKAPAEQEDGGTPGETAPPEAVSLVLWQYDSAHALAVTGGRSLLVPKEEALGLAAELDEILAAD